MRHGTHAAHGAAPEGAVVVPQERAHHVLGGSWDAAARAPALQAVPHLLHGRKVRLGFGQELGVVEACRCPVSLVQKP